MRRFWSDRKGNVAVLFAFAVVPVIGGLGAAIDYSMANSYRTDMQKALDSTALALSKVLPADEATMNKVGNEYFFASLGNHTMTEVSLSIVPGDGKVALRATGKYKPGLANLLGAQEFTIGASSEAVWSMGKVEIALVLDMSLSMQIPDTARIEALRTSTVNLLDVLETAARNPGDAKVGIVPFDGMVNVGYTYATRPNWVRFDWWEENVGSCNTGGHSNKTDCQAHYYCSKSWYTSKNSCQNNGGTWRQAVWSGESKSNWNGCIYDRRPDLDHDVLDTAPDNTTATTGAALETKYPAAKCYATPPQAITPLSTDWTMLRTKANNLTPTGYTNIPIGLAWGWHVLSPTYVHMDGASYGTEDLTKYIILMTDGYNTKNILMHPDACNTNGPTCPVIDDRMEEVCDNIKTAGIKIYTIRLIAGNADLLRDCATDPNMYYDVQNAGQLASVFGAIGSQIASLHLAK